VIEWYGKYRERLKFNWDRRESGIYREGDKFVEGKGGVRWLFRLSRMRKVLRGGRRG
jgi:hypothetical protein